jgi:nickel-dependent lactate racemase
VESDVSIAVGNIIPHMYAGWAGGSKMVQPGVSNHLTTGVTHLMAGPSVYEILGSVGNRIRIEMDQVAKQSGLKFILNVVLNRDGNVIDVVAGDVVEAHRAGVKIAEPIYTVEIDEKVDIVVAGAHPADRDLWQGCKPLTGCGMLAKDGGTIILIIEAAEGIAPDHPQFSQFGMTTGDEVQRMIAANEITDLVAAATYLAFEQTRKRLHISLVCRTISAKEAAQIGIDVYPEFESAMKDAKARHGQKSRIGVVTHGADILGKMKRAEKSS